jgi:hypothetical protein
MNDTPRTDAAVVRCACSDYVIEPDFARTLERELAQVNLELESVKSGCAKVCREIRADNAKLTAERDEARQTCAELVTDSNAVTLAASLARVSIDNARLRETGLQSAKYAESLQAYVARLESEFPKLQALHGCSQEMVIHWCEHAVKRANRLEAENSALREKYRPFELGESYLLRERAEKAEADNARLREALAGIAAYSHEGEECGCMAKARAALAEGGKTMDASLNDKRTIDDATQAEWEAAQRKEWYRKSAKIEADSCVSAGKMSFHCTKQETKP